MSNLEILFCIGGTLGVYGAVMSWALRTAYGKRIDDLERKLDLRGTDVTFENHVKSELIRVNECIRSKLERIEESQAKHINDELTRIDQELKAEWRKVGEDYRRMNEHSMNHGKQIERGLKIVEESMEVIRGLMK